MTKAARNRAERARRLAREAQSVGLRLDHELPGDVTGHGFYWLPMRFTCGHAIDYGIDLVKYGPQGRSKLEHFLDDAAAYPCVRCGSATNVPHDLPIGAEPTYLVANDIWFRACPADQQRDATRNAKAAAARRKRNR